MGRLASRAFYARRDDSEPQIVAALEAAGWHVWRKLPVDLLLWHPVHGFDCLEAKSLGKPLEAKPGPQKAFVDVTGCAIVSTPEQALEAVKRDGSFVPPP